MFPRDYDSYCISVKVLSDHITFPVVLWVLHFGKDAPALRRNKMGGNCVVFRVVHSAKMKFIHLQFRAINVLFGANSEADIFSERVYLNSTFYRNTLFIPVLQ